MNRIAIVNWGQSRVNWGQSRIPREFIPKLVDHIVHGRFPLERLITFYDLADINRAAHDSSNGTTIKPVLRMPRGRRAEGMDNSVF